MDVYMQHVQDGVTRDQIKDLMRQETWFDYEKMQQYFDVEIEEKQQLQHVHLIILLNTTICRSLWESQRRRIL